MQGRVHYLEAEIARLQETADREQGDYRRLRAENIRLREAAQPRLLVVDVDTLEEDHTSTA